jgi:periplasmic protein CpxP/Spy
MKLKRIITGAVLAAIVALAGVAGIAQDQQEAEGQGRQERGEHRGGKGRGFGGGRFFEKLNLTDAQREQIRQISERYHNAFKAQRQQNRGERRGGFDAFQGGTFDEGAVRAAAQARANAQVEMEVQRARMMFEMYNVLTPEQKAQLAAERQQREQRRQERRARRQAGNTTED